jgi:epoxyqueuosine reductase
MKILVHTCCAPCAIYPVEILRDQHFEVTGFFYRNNIHPYTECLKREQTLTDYAEKIHLSVIYQDGYDLEGFLRKIIFHENDRCAICYQDRLTTTALIAKERGFDCFTSTLLYSKYQKHETVKEIGESIGASLSLPFYYRDFREGWKEGIHLSKRLNMYRQPYCGCIYSEKERFYSSKKVL